ncbi:MAG: ribonuclease [Thermoleophilia bacterium]|jgi:ribonuclease PH|nr:ribonuclease [Thermoleophilia bacterium]
MTQHTETAVAPIAAPVERPLGRAHEALRPVRFTPGFAHNAYASVLVEFGGTRVLCTASVEESVPRWMVGKGEGWVTAEYDMLPASTGDRRRRDARKGKLDGRTIEISRLIGRSLRAVVDNGALGERLVTIDCDVIDADGGTRCAAICGGYVALHRAALRLMEDGLITKLPFTDTVAAVSMGMLGGAARLDLEYVEDSTADVDMNLVATGRGNLVEVQSSAEGATFSRVELDAMIDLGLAGLDDIRALQLAAIEA